MGSGGVTVTVRYWAAARAAAGTPEEPIAGVTTLAELLDAVAGRHGAGLGRVLARSSLLLDGTGVSSRDPADVVLHEGAVVEVLPPFAGG